MKIEIGARDIARAEIGLYLTDIEFDAPVELKTLMKQVPSKEISPVLGRYSGTKVSDFIAGELDFVTGEEETEWKKFFHKKRIEFLEEFAKERLAKAEKNADESN